MIKVKVDLSESGEDESVRPFSSRSQHDNTSFSFAQDTSDGPSTRPHLHRTSTGIISHRRPISGTPALSNSGSTTPSSSSDPFTRRRNISLLTAAKQEAARRTLYSMFFRGPVMRSDDVLNIVEEDNSKTAEVEVAVL